MPQTPETSTSAQSPTRLVALARFGMRTLRIAASTLALVALVRQQWLAGVCFTLAWLLILGSPRLFPSLAETSIPPPKL
ncbi:MAG: hypothetical protein WAM11_13460 [Cyanobium sp.]